MLDQVINEIKRRQLPYYNLEGDAIKGVDNQYWLVFKHRDAGNKFKEFFSLRLFGIGEKPKTHKLIRINLNDASVYEYIPKKPDNIPSLILLRTNKISRLEAFLECVDAKTEKALLINSFLDINIKKRRRFSLPKDVDNYQKFIGAYLAKTTLYRRSTAFFNSGVLKLYEEPLQQMLVMGGEIRLLMDLQGFTNQRDVEELRKLNDPLYRSHYIQRTLEEFLQALETKAFTSTQLLAELVRLEFLRIKLIKMEGGKGIFHKKTGILTDSLGNSILHDGSDNFTYSAHNLNSESITVLYWSDAIDNGAIADSIEEFDEEWNSVHAFDLTNEFLTQVRRESQRRYEANQPRITDCDPSTLEAGETTTVKITGHNLQDIQAIAVEDTDQIRLTIEETTSDQLTAQAIVAPNYPPQSIKSLVVATSKHTYQVEPAQELTVTNKLTVPEFSEIEGFKAAIKTILAGNYGTPNDFLYWLGLQNPKLWQIQSSGALDQWVNEGILFEHQKSGAQHSYRVMKDFGVAVCADAVGLGKSRLGAAVGKLYREENGQAKIAIIAARKLHDNWRKEMKVLGFGRNDYELYNKNLMSRKGSFIDDFNRFGGPDLILIDEAHEGIRNYNNRIHRTCLQIRARDREEGRERHYLLLTATPWNNRREDIYNILSPFVTKTDGFSQYGLPEVIGDWLNQRDIGVENLTDDTRIFRQLYKELFLQRTRKQLMDASPDLRLYAKRQAEWLVVNFESETEQALDQIFGHFEHSLFIPSSDPIRYLNDQDVGQRSLLSNQRRMFLQRAESSMYALKLTIRNFSQRIQQVKDRLSELTPDAEGLLRFLMIHYKFESEHGNQAEIDWGMEEDEADEFEDEEDEDGEQEEQRQQLRRSIEIATDALKDDPERAAAIYERILEDCDSDLERLANIQGLLETEFVTDHKREEVTKKVRELVSRGHKVLLISVFADTVMDYYQYMKADPVISLQGIGMAMGASKHYLKDGKAIGFTPHGIHKNGKDLRGIKRRELFRCFAPGATCENPADYPKRDEEINVLVGSETLSVGQNLQDANYLICIDLPWNPMVLEQRIGRIDRPKKHPVEFITIYYANSESQLLRQATRLNNLHKKMVGDLIDDQGNIPRIQNMEQLGPSVYGDTLFDDEILPGYIDFIKSLVQARRFEQDNLQENAYQKQEGAQEVYTHNEILYNEDLKRLMNAMPEGYQPNPIAIGTGDDTNLKVVTALKLKYFGPNGEPIEDKTETIFWNNATGEVDGHGQAIAAGFKTPELSDVVSTQPLLSLAETTYQQLVNLKEQRQAELEQPETLENISLTSERLAKINRRLQTIESVPEEITGQMVRATLKILQQHKTKKAVQLLLRSLTDGEKSKLSNNDFIKELVNETGKLALLDYETTKPTNLTVAVEAILVRI
ncbi:helicase-related protein [Synechocystis sp. PCC 6714]|uniref:helicase-related protein n=1 Tax=Synechocystis sp. (strain PCC 6714) TaxID=1147 RepID=UPI000422BE8E|nr:helicase-related protein [Synechocystis sp. PCC 6714]AIE76085.1 hypothetical protein D082_40390 [Synechocystis sp. PCC 6714]